MKLEPSAEEMREWLQNATDRIVPFIASLQEQPVSGGPLPEEIRKKIREPLPRKGQSYDSVLKMIFDDILPYGTNLPSSGYLAYIPVGGLFHSVVAELITFAINRWPGLYDWSPGFIEIETTVIKWLNEIMGLPSDAGGILTSGGSIANFEAIVTARSEKLGEQFLNGTIYCSDQAHHSVLKAATLAGIPRSNVKKIESDESFKINIESLVRVVESDLKKGLKPFLVVGNGGTTSTGAVDPLSKLAEVAKKYGLWFHVDAAWAGAFRLTKNGKSLFSGIEQADTVTFDPHKALFLPFGCGALLVRDVTALKRAHSFEADYLPSESDPEKDQLNPSQISAELSRTLRGLQVWLPFKMLGVQPFIESLEEKLELTDWITTELKKIPEVEIVAEPQTSIVAFRVLSKDGDHDGRTKRVLDYINSKKLILLSGASLKGRFAIRVVPFAHRTHKKHVELTLSYILDGLKQT